MKLGNWHERWQIRNINFHLSQVHPDLIKYVSELTLPAQGRCFVPLCGKSLDLEWIAKNLGHQVTGVEFSPIPIQEFFSEHNLTAHRENQQNHVLYKAQNIEIYQGDFFSLPSTLNHQFDWIYDRASLVAINPEQRKDYVKKCTSMLKEDGKILLLSFHYDPESFEGPPHSLSKDQIQKLYGGAFSITHLAEDRKSVV